MKTEYLVTGISKDRIIKFFKEKGSMTMIEFSMNIPKSRECTPDQLKGGLHDLIQEGVISKKDTPKRHSKLWVLAESE